MDSLCDRAKPALKREGQLAVHKELQAATHQVHRQAPLRRHRHHRGPARRLLAVEQVQQAAARAVALPRRLKQLR
eukprot:scaffold61757_cov40-Phaeocystis_antarctica.AAC.1